MKYGGEDFPWSRNQGWHGGRFIFGVSDVLCHRQQRSRLCARTNEKTMESKYLEPAARLIIVDFTALALREHRSHPFRCLIIATFLIYLQIYDVTFPDFARDSGQQSRCSFLPTTICTRGLQPNPFCLCLLQVHLRARIVHLKGWSSLLVPH